MLTRKQEKSFVKLYHRLQSGVSQSNISAEKASEALDKFFEKMDKHRFDNWDTNSLNILGFEGTAEDIIADMKAKKQREIFNVIAIRYLENPQARAEIKEIMPDLAEELDAIREYIDVLSKEAMSRGIMLPSQFHKWKDKYLSRLYLIQSPDIGAKADATAGIRMETVKSGRKIESIVDYIAEFPAEARRLGVVLDPNMMIKQTIAKTQGNIAIEEFYREIIERSDIADENSLISLSEGIAKLPMRFSPAYAKKVVIPYIQDMIKNLKNEADQKGEIDAYTIMGHVDFLKDEIENISEEIKIKEATLGKYDKKKYAEVPDDRRYGAIAGLPMSKDVVSLVKSQYQAVNEPEMLTQEIGQALTKALVYFKWAKVPGNAYAYPRNLFSNQFQWIKSGANPAAFLPEWGKAAHDMATEGEWYEKARAAGILNTNNVTLEVNNALKVIAADMQENAVFLKRTKLWFNKKMQTIGDAYGVIDDVAKIARFKYAIENEGATLAEATAKAQETHYDYGLTYDIIRNMRDPDMSKGVAVKLMGTLFPTYTAKTIAFLIDSLVERPITQALMYSALYAFVKGDEDEDREKIGAKRYDKILKTLPDWVDNNPLIKIEMKELKDGTVDVTLTDIGYVVPEGGVMAALYTAGQGDISGAAMELGLGGHPIQMMTELKNNLDAFTGKQIYYEHDALQKTKDIASYMGEKLSPGTITKTINLFNTRHPVLPRIIGVNTYTYNSKELEDWSEFRAKQATMDAGKRAMKHKRKIQQADKALANGKIDKGEHQQIVRKEQKEVVRWKELGEEAYQKESVKSVGYKKYNEKAKKIRATMREYRELKKFAASSKGNDIALDRFKKDPDNRIYINKYKKVLQADRAVKKIKDKLNTVDRATSITEDRRQQLTKKFNAELDSLYERAGDRL